MRYSHFALVLSTLLAGCVTNSPGLTPKYSYDHYDTTDARRERARIERQMKRNQRQFEETERKLQENHRNLYQRQQEVLRAQQQELERSRLQMEARLRESQEQQRRAQEAANIQALERATREEQLRHREERDFEQARINSLRTHAEEEAKRTGQVVPSQSAPWEPRSGDVARAGKLIMELQRAKGSQPTTAEIRTDLQQKMNLSSEQVEAVIKALMLD